MIENLFIASQQEIVSKVVYVNVNFNLYNGNRNSPKKFEHFFFYNRYKQNVYYAKILSIKEIEFNEEFKEDTNGFTIRINFKNGFFEIKFENALVEGSISLLKHVYAKCNKAMIGDGAFSIYNTIKLSNFTYALPVVDETTFMNDDEFRDLLLYDNYMIPSDSEERKTFAKIIMEDNEFSLTLTNESMIELDYRYLLNEGNKEIYRPYFYEFFLNDSSQEKLKSELDSQIYSEELLYEIKIISLRDIKSKSEEGLIEGELLFSASPIKRIPAYIKILHTNNDKIVEYQFDKIKKCLKSEIIPVQNSSDVEKVLMKKILISKSAVINYKVKIYNVGQGNWIHILVKDGSNLISKIVFDIGIGNGKGAHSNSNLVEEVTKDAAKSINSNDMFILSHWDMDHILGVVKLQRNQYYTTWIAPDLPRKPSNGALRLAAFLKIDTNIKETFVDHGLNGNIIVDNDFLLLGKGSGKKSFYTTENNSGLILTIKTANKNMLLPGDCEYSEFPSGYLGGQNYDALVVTHHGAKIKQSDLTSLGFIKSATNKFAAVCVGGNKSYPNCSHETSISALGYKIDKTRDFKNFNYPCQIQLT